MTESFIKYLRSFPEQLTAHDLVKIGFYPSIKSAVNARFLENSPPSVKDNNSIWFPRDAFIEFLKERFIACRKGRRKYTANVSIDEIEKTTTPLMSIKSLLTLNIFENEDQSYSCRASGCGPSYIRVGHKILYLRDEVLNLLEPSNN